MYNDQNFHENNMKARELWESYLLFIGQLEYSLFSIQVT